MTDEKNIPHEENFCVDCVHIRDINLLQQGEEKLLHSLAISWQDPGGILAGFEKDNNAEPYITGYYFFLELEERIGRTGFLDFVREVMNTDQYIKDTLRNVPGYPIVKSEGGQPISNKLPAKVLEDTKGRPVQPTQGTTDPDYASGGASGM